MFSNKTSSQHLTIDCLSLYIYLFEIQNHFQLQGDRFTDYSSKTFITQNKLRRAVASPQFDVQKLFPLLPCCYQSKCDPYDLHCHHIASKLSVFSVSAANFCHGTSTNFLFVFIGFGTVEFYPNFICKSPFCRSNLMPMFIVSVGFRISHFLS